MGWDCDHLRAINCNTTLWKEIYLYETYPEWSYIYEREKGRAFTALIDLTDNNCDFNIINSHHGPRVVPNALRSKIVITISLAKNEFWNWAVANLTGLYDDNVTHEICSIEPDLRNWIYVQMAQGRIDCRVIGLDWGVTVKSWNRQACRASQP